MKKLLFILLLCITTSAFGQFFAPNQKPCLGLQVNWGHALSQGLVGCWLFNEGSGNVFDLSGNGNNGNLGDSGSNVPTWVAGLAGPALDFNDDVVMVDDSPTLKPNHITVFVRAKADAELDYSYLVGKTEADDSLGYVLQQRSDANVWFWSIYSDGAWRYSLSTTDPANKLGEWVNVIGTYDGAYTRIYIDGIEEDSDAHAGVISNSTQILTIGHDLNHSPASRGFDGAIDLVAIWNRALSPSEIALAGREPFCFMEPSWNWNLYGAISVVTPTGQIIFINMN